MKCSKCNNKIRDRIVLNEYGVNVNSLPDQEGVLHYFCNYCSELMGLTKARNKLSRQISTLKKASFKK